MKVILAPHLDDEVIGCYSILEQVDKVVYWLKDYRMDNPRAKFEHYKGFNFEQLTGDDTVYMPSKYDYHPLHQKVRYFGLGLPCKKMFYSVEMNVPWLEEEKDAKGKKEMFNKMYPMEDMPNDKYWLFKSIKPYDDIVWAEAPALTTGGMSILLMMAPILNAVQAGLNKMQQSVE